MAGVAQVDTLAFCCPSTILRTRGIRLPCRTSILLKQPAPCTPSWSLTDMLRLQQVADLTAELHARALELKHQQLSSEAALQDQTAAAHAERQAAAAATAAAVARQEQLDAELTRCRAAAEQELRLRVSAEETLKQHTEVPL